MSLEEENLEITRQYLATVGFGSVDDDLSFFAEDVVQVEFPNRIVPKGMTRDLTALRESAERGRKVMASQRFDLVSAVATGDRVAVEAVWVGVLAMPLGNLPAGGEMRVRTAMFLTFREGKIVRQHNYDCFEPW